MMFRVGTMVVRTLGIRIFVPFDSSRWSILKLILSITEHESRDTLVQAFFFFFSFVDNRPPADYLDRES